MYYSGLIYKLKEIHTNIHIFAHYLWNHRLKEHTMKELLGILCKKRTMKGLVKIKINYVFLLCLTGINNNN